MPVQIGILGFGKMGQIRADAVVADGRGQIRKVFDVHYDGTPAYPCAASIDEIIQDADIDAVFVCTPNWMNKDTTIAALKAGKHVFCEKPPAFNAAEMREIIEVERASDRVLMYGFNHRHHAAVVKMKQIIGSHAYGRVLWMRGRYGKSVDANYLKSWRADRKLAAGGILLDQGIHMLDLFLYLSEGNFDIVHALVSSRYWNIPGIEDNVFAIMRNSASGVEVSFHSTMTQWRHLFSLEVFLERGYLVLNGLKTSSNSYGEEVLTVAKNRSSAPAAVWEDEECLHYKVDTSWTREGELFMDAVTLGVPVETGSSQQALDVLSLVDEIYRNEHTVSAFLHKDLSVVPRSGGRFDVRP